MAADRDDKQMIRSQLLSLGALVLLTGSVALGAYWYTLHEESSARITQIEEVKRIEITVPEKEAEGRQSTVLSLSDDGLWFIEQPFRAKAAGSRIQSLTVLANRSFEHAYTLEEVDLAQLGLEPPQVLVRFNDEEISLGNTDELTKLRYARHGDRVLLLDNAAYELLDSDVYGLCENRLSQYASDITAVQLGRFRLTAGEGDSGWSWQEVEGAVPHTGQESQAIEDLSADQKRLDDWVNSISYAYALRASDGREQRAAHEGEPARFIIEMAEGELVDYELVAGEEETIFHSPDNGVNHHFSTESQNSVLKPPLRSADAKPELDDSLQPEEAPASPVIDD